MGKERPSWFGIPNRQRFERFGARVHLRSGVIGGLAGLPDRVTLQRRPDFRGSSLGTGLLWHQGVQVSTDRDDICAGREG